MNIILMHGDHTTKSYQRLIKFIIEAKKRGWEIVRVGKGDADILPELISSNSLFGIERFFILEEPNKVSKTTLFWLKKNSKNFIGNLVIYSSTTLSKTALKEFPVISKTESFELPKLIFNFLENIYPGNSEKILKMLHRILEKEPVEFVFALMARHLRDLYWVKADDKTISLPSWRISKLRNQSKMFTDEKLQSLISSLAEIDVLVKTSQTSLISALDLMIASELE